MGKTTKDTSTTSAKDGPSTMNAPTSDKFGVHLAQMAWRVALSFLSFSVGGIFLDRSLNSEPAFSLIGFALAIMSTTAVVYIYVKKNFPETFGGSGE